MMFYLWLYEKTTSLSPPNIYMNLDLWNRTTRVALEEARKRFQEMSMEYLYQYFLETPSYPWIFKEARASYNKWLSRSFSRKKEEGKKGGKTMKSPINQLNAQLLRTKAELGSIQEMLKHLREDHGRLVKDWVRQENEIEDLKESIEEMCGLCSTKGTEMCSICPLQSPAVRFGLWEEGK